jgi:hypothetical protein
LFNGIASKNALRSSSAASFSEAKTASSKSKMTASASKTSAFCNIPG